MTRSFKPILALLMMMLCGAAATAQSYMTFYNNDGSAKNSWSLLDVSKVTFDEGNIVVALSTGNQTYAINDVLSIKFTDTGSSDPTAIGRIDDDAAMLRIATGENSIRVIGANQGQVAIWAVTGQQIYDNHDWRGEEINISHLERGIYIITINNSTFKFKK
ncbi:MAG: T9SS type A sorting domain-containing protein [Muribaculaceae bacterium]|nr:T9SS type A sorting domain-containing protein [Muribaculaceae bacterium]